MRTVTMVRVFVYNIQYKLSRSEAKGLLGSGEILPNNTTFETQLAEHVNLTDNALALVVEQHLSVAADRTVLDFDMEIFRD